MLKHVIHNHKKILNEGVADNFEKTIHEQTEKLRRFFKRYRKPVILEVILSHDDRKYHITTKLNMRSGPLIIKRKAVDLWPLTREVFDVLRKEITETLKKERHEYLYKRKERQVRRFGEMLSQLEETHREDDRDTFGYLFKSGIPGLRNYLNRRLRQVGITSDAGEELNVDELINELYLRVYDRFGELPKEQPKMLSWLFNMADALLEEKLRENDLLETGDVTFNAEQYDWEEPETSFSIDAEGELVPLEEFDDPVYLHNMYQVEDIFSDKRDEAEYIRQQIDKKMTREEFHNRVSAELIRLPFFKRSVFDLYILDRFDRAEIAEIKKCTEDEIDRALIEARSLLRERIRNWTGKDESVS